MRKTLALILLLLAASLPLLANIQLAPGGSLWLASGGIVYIASGSAIATDTPSPSDVTATMTGFTTPSPYVVTAGGSYFQPAWQAFDHNITSTKYWGSVAAADYVTFDFSASEPYAIQKVRWLGNAANNNPKSFRVIAWNAGDVSSTTLYIGTGTNSLDWQEFTWTNTTEYRYYRFDVKSTVGGSAIRVYEIEYWE